MSHVSASRVFWQAKIWGMLHDPVLKSLHDNSGQEGKSFWQELAVMQDWQERRVNAEGLDRVELAGLIAAASDRAALGSLSSRVKYGDEGLEIFHLLSGAKQSLKIKQHDELGKGAARVEFLNAIERSLLLLEMNDPSDREHPIPKPIKDITCPHKLFWWLWRCLPQAVCKSMDGDPSLFLMPAETSLPDSSIWGHTSLTAAFAGALAGYDTSREPQSRQEKEPSHAYLATFSFTPIQELIKASRKMRDFWAGSWILHYLSAKVSWALAWKYGPDCLVYPSLFQQPLIDHWLLNGTGSFKGWEEFKDWIEPPTERQLLTAGFPNVLVVLLPKDRVEAAMQMAEQTLKDEWKNLGKLVFKKLQSDRHWMPDLKSESHTWQGWLEAQWQTYWSALPVGVEGEELKSTGIPINQEDASQLWVDAQNQAYRVNKKSEGCLFQESELEFLRQVFKLNSENSEQESSVNVGSWWSDIFDQTRLSLTAVKNVRTWEIPTAFSVRSTVSGVGSAVHPGKDWIPEGKVGDLWERQAGLFDGIEQLNATETLKRGLHLILPKLLGLSESKINAAYPDLTVGVAGYLKVKKVEGEKHLEHFQQACEAVDRESGIRNHTGWGIPWIDENPELAYRRYHPRSLNAGWLLEEEAQTPTDDRRNDIQRIIDRHYPTHNPTDWYVLAAGDGDGMNEWLKGTKLEKYRAYVPESLSNSVTEDPLQNFLNVRKRMGPSTHNALSRALLDFSNQLVPYLTEQRYAGRLIYGGGDDVLAYTNLWEWDSWLWDIRQCFRGDKDERNQFKRDGDYWQCHDLEDKGISSRPLFTMGGRATISFGIVIAHQSVPLAIALEHLWDAESKGAKEYVSLEDEDGRPKKKDAVQVRVLYGNGNVLKSTTRFDVFQDWRSLMNLELEPALFEQAAQVWEQHPIPTLEAIAAWTHAFCDRREVFQSSPEDKERFRGQLEQFLRRMWMTSQPNQRDGEVKNWLKLAAFVLRNRDIQWRNL